MVKLNLGCGNDYKEGYVNVDWDAKYCTNGVDLITDIRCIPLEHNSVEEIVAEGCLEHLSHRDVVPTLYHWFCLLAPGGKLIIETPNLIRVMEEFVKDPFIINSHAYETLYGGQRNRTEVHLGLWTGFNLGQLMVLVGFKNVDQISPSKNLESGPEWNIRMIGDKLYEWSFPNCAKCNKEVKVNACLASSQ